MRWIQIFIFHPAPLLILVGLFVLSGLVPATPAQAAVGINSSVNFQGRLLNAAGAVVADGTYNMQFKIYQDGAGTAAGNPGGTLMWTESWVYGVNTPDNRVTVKNGYFSVPLGTICAFTSTTCTANTGNAQTNTVMDFNQDTLWLSTNIENAAGATAQCTGFASGSPASCTGGDGEMLSMRRMGSSVYALNAGELGGLSSAGYIQNVAPNLSQQTANINILSGAATTVAAAQIQAVASATAPVLVVKGGATPGAGGDLLQLQNSAATVVAKFDSTGNLTAGTIASGLINGQTISSAANFTGTVSAATSLMTPLLDAASAVALNVGTTNATAINLNQNTTILGGKNLTLASGAGVFSQTNTGTTTHAHAITANSLTTGTALKVTSANNSAADISWSAISLNPTNSQGTTAVSGTNLISGLDIQFVQAPTIAGNNETVANLAVAANAGSPTDQTVASILSLANNDTATGNQITVTDGIKISGANVTNGINLSGTFGTNLITSSNFGVTQGGALTSKTALFLPASDSLAAPTLTVQTSTGNNSFTVGSSATLNQVGIGLGSTALPSLVGSGLEVKGAIKLTGGAIGNTDTFTTSLGTSVATKINIPLYDPGAFSQLIAMGLSSTANNTARALSLFDARTVAHQPTIGVFSPDENNILGLSWDGSNATSYLKATGGDIAIRSSATDIATFASSAISLLQNTTVAANNSFSANGTALFKSATDSTTAFQVQNAAGTPILTTDTTNLVVKIADNASIVLGSSVGNAKSAVSKDLTCTATEQVNDIVVISGAGTVAQTATANSAKVAGVVESKPAATTCRVAISGMVKVQFGTNAAPGFGDGVATSTIAGAAQGVAGPTVVGSVVGKATDNAKDGSNLVWVLLGAGN